MKRFTICCLRAIIVCLLGLSLSPLQAQESVYKGQVRDVHSKGLEFVTIQALSLPDSTFVQGEVSDQEGRFTLRIPKDKLPKQGLVFKVSALGYSTKIATPSELGNIVLQEQTIALDAVQVRGSRKPFVQKANVLVCNVAGTILSKEATTADILAKLPGFYAQAGELKLFKKGEAVYFVNNRPASWEEVARLEVGSIKSVEINHNPGARFSSEVGAVVMIRTHRSLEGVSAFVRSQTRVNHRFSESLDGEFSLQRNKLRLTLGAEYALQQKKSGQENTFSRLDPSRQWSVTSRDDKSRDRNTKQMLFVATDYSFADQHQLRLSYRFTPTQSDGRFAGWLRLQDRGLEEREHFGGDYQDDSQRNHLNLFYTLPLSKALSLEISADWLKQTNSSEQTLREVTGLTLAKNSANNNLLGVAPRLVYRLGASQVQLGADWSKSTVERQTEFENNDLGQTRNEIQEEKRALYSEYSWASKNRQWYLSLGLRYEQLARQYRNLLLLSGKPLQNSYNSLLPSVSLSYSTSKGWGHQFAYDQSLVYPSFEQIAGAPVYINRFNYRVSNAELEQSRLHKLSYNASYKWLFLSGEYAYTDRPILEVFDAEERQASYRIKVKPINLSSMHSLSFIANLAPRFGFYAPQLTLGYIKNFMRLEAEPSAPESSISKPFAIVALSNNFSLPGQWTLGVDFSYNGAGSSGYVEFSATGSIDLSLQKSFFNQRLKLHLKLSDLLDSSTPRINGAVKGIALQGVSWQDRRNLRLVATWQFNKHKSKRVRSAVGSELNRL